jgi:eukaryotic-like serine/threonine-protein kinase
MSEPNCNEELSVRPGDVLDGRYRLGRVIASGGMGYVLAATHHELDTPFAVKVLKLKFACDKTYVARFRREALAAAKLRSDHIVHAVDFGTTPDTGVPYLVMEYLEGHDLASALEGTLTNSRGGLPTRDVCDYVMQACSGLAVAHAAGIVHRDLKPANLFLTRRPDGSPCIKLLDFGISKHTTSESMVLTSAREVLGSPLYMSPEQLKSPHSVDTRSDIWSVGVILFELLTGHTPFEGRAFGEVFLRIQTEAAPSLLDFRPDLPAGLDEIVKRCLQKDPNDRFQTVSALAKELAAFASPGAEKLVAETQQLDRLLAVTQAGPESAPLAADSPAPSSAAASQSQSLALAATSQPPAAASSQSLAAAASEPLASDPSLPASGREAPAHAVPSSGHLAVARRIFGTKTLAPLTGDAERPYPWLGMPLSKRLLAASTLAGVLLGCGGWAIARHYDAPPAVALAPAALAAPARQLAADGAATPDNAATPQVTLTTVAAVADVAALEEQDATTEAVLPNAPFSPADSARPRTESAASHLAAPARAGAPTPSAKRVSVRRRFVEPSIY